jgi:hypothetical protein
MNTLENWRTPPHDRAIGIEVECFIRDDAFNKAERDNEYSDYYGFFYAAYDGSIQKPSWDYVAKEFVSQPLTPSWLKKELKKLYDTFPIEWNDSCGIHVHVSKKWLTNKKAEAIQKWIASLSEEQFRELFGRWPNSYCSQTDGSTSRYRAVNVTNEKTNEFRVFSSGGLRWAQYCVDMAEYLVKNAYHLNYEAALAFKDMVKFQ